MRKPNTKCKLCETPIYRRPFEIESYGANLYCSKKCMYDDRKVVATCPVCGIDFQKKNNKQIYCDKRCSGKITRNRLGTKKGYRKTKNTSEVRLQMLRDTFGFESCMVRGCSYSRTFDIHRLIKGKDGGKYEIGNMYAICPNHHAEVHRNLIILKKISDCELEIIKLAQV